MKAPRTGAEYRSWKSMLHRCRNRSDKWYGAKGISFASEWASFENFYADMGPSHGLTPERKDNSKGYFKDNCTWAGKQAQSNNRGEFNRRLTFRRRTMTVAQWAEVVGICRHRIYQRLNRGWTAEQALTRPVKRSVP